MTTHCFYHSTDLDGHCSGAIVKFFRPECVLHPYTYGQPFPWDEIKSDDEVYMVDLSMPPKDLLRLDSMCTFYWIDHHKSPMEDAENGGATHIKGIREIGKAGCELIWEYLDINGDVPRAVWLLARHDLWEHDDPDVEPFQYAMRSKPTFPEENMRLWSDLFSGTLNGESPEGEDEDYLLLAMIERGKAVLSYVQEDARKACKFQAFDLQFKGLNLLAINQAGNSSILSSAVRPEHDAVMLFSWSNKGHWHVSLFDNSVSKKDVDLSVIAQEFGGGGHKGAAGFTCKELPFKLGVKSDES